MAKKKKASKKRKVRVLAKHKRAAGKKTARRRTTTSLKKPLPQVTEQLRKAALAKAAAASGSRGVQTRFAGTPEVEPLEVHDLIEDGQELESGISDDESSENEIPPEYGGEH